MRKKKKKRGSVRELQALPKHSYCFKIGRGAKTSIKEDVGPPAYEKKRKGNIEKGGPESTPRGSEKMDSTMLVDERKKDVKALSLLYWKKRGKGPG